LTLEQTPLTQGNKIYRMLWCVVWLLACRWTPVFLFSWRRFILILFGAHIEKTALVYPSVNIWSPLNLYLCSGSCLGPHVNFYNVAKITVGHDTIISQNTTLCSASRKLDDSEILLSSPIVIGKKVWIAMEAFVGPGVTIGEYSVVYARSVVVKNLSNGDIVAGNPAKKVKQNILENSEHEK
jgi:putative colanic acid biosynthesis acetyltransferase WcaF